MSFRNASLDMALALEWMHPKAKLERMGEQVEILPTDVHDADKEVLLYDFLDQWNENKPYVNFKTLLNVYRFSAITALTMSVHPTSTGDSMETGMNLTNGPISGCFFSVLFMVEAQMGASATLKSMLPPTLCINFCGVSAKKCATKS